MPTTGGIPPSLWAFPASADGPESHLCTFFTDAGSQSSLSVRASGDNDDSADASWAQSSLSKARSSARLGWGHAGAAEPPASLRTDPRSCLQSACEKARADTAPPLLAQQPPESAHCTGFLDRVVVSSLHRCF